MTFVVIGAGPTGVELAGALAEIAVHSMVKEFHAIDPGSARVILVEGTDRVLPAYPEVLSRSARRQLETLGVEVRTDAMVEKVDEEGVTLLGGERIEAANVLWAAGVRASPLGSLLADTDRTGRVAVSPDLSLPGHPEVFVIGDLAVVPGVPGVAPAAMQMGRHAGRSIESDLDRPAAARVPLPEQGVAGDYRPGTGGRRLSSVRRLGLSRLGRLAGDPCLLLDRVQEPAAGSDVLGLELSDLPARGSDNHRRAPDVENR